MRLKPRALRRRYVDTPMYLQMVERMIRAAGHRVGGSEPADYATLCRLHLALDDAMEHAIRGLRNGGYTWDEIGAANGTTRQAPIMRWAKRI